MLNPRNYINISRKNFTDEEEVRIFAPGKGI